MKVLPEPKLEPDEIGCFSLRTDFQYTKTEKLKSVAEITFHLQPKATDFVSFFRTSKKSFYNRKAVLICTFCNRKISKYKLLIGSCFGSDRTLKTIMERP